MSGQHDVLTVSMFGDLRISVDNLPIPRIPAKAQELFALLILWNDLPISRQRLASTLWPDSKQPNARGLLRSCLMELRKALGPAAVRLPTEDRTTLQLDLAGVYVDVFEFDHAVSQNTPEADQTARALYRHELLQGWQAAWVQPERARRAVAYAGLQQRTRTVAAPPSSAVTTSEHHSSSWTRPQLSGTLAEIRALLASNREQLRATTSRLGRLEKQLESMAPDLVIEDPAPRAESLYALAVSKHMEGDLEGSRACLQQALQITQELHTPTLRATVLHQLGRLEVYRDKDAARGYFQQAYALRTEQQQEILESIVSSLLGLGDVAATIDDAMDYYQKALRIAESNQDECGIAWANFSLGVAPVYRNVWEPASLTTTLRHFQRALEGFGRIQDTTGLFAVFDGLAQVCHRIGDDPGTEKLLAMETLLRTRYSTPRVRNEDTDDTVPFFAMRRAASELGADTDLEFGWPEAVQEAEKTIRRLPEILRST